MLDALDVPSAHRGDVLGFAAGFIRRHPDLIRDTEWGLFAVGSGEGFEEEGGLNRPRLYLARRVLLRGGDFGTAVC